MSNVSIRRRVSSYQHHEEEEEEGEEGEEGEEESQQDRRYRVPRAPSSAGVSPLSSEPTNRGRSYRKAVPHLSPDDNHEAIVLRAGNILMEQVTLQAIRQSVPQRAPSLLLPPLTVHTVAPDNLEHIAETSHNCDESYSASAAYDHYWNGPAAAFSDLDGREHYSNHSSALSTQSFPVSPSLRVAPEEDTKGLEGDFAHSMSATSTLISLGRSLQWSQKLPQGRHLSRRKSHILQEEYMGAAMENSRLAEARAGLRLLAQEPRDMGPATALPTRLDKWNRFKLGLFFSVLLVLVYGVLGLITSLLTWARAWASAEISTIVDTDIIILMSVASSLCLSTSIVGICGAILNSRPILSLHAFLLWPSLLSMLTVGYTSYKRANLRLDLKLNQVWSRYMDDLARLRVQEILQCCGYYNPLHQATFSRLCYPRTTLPGCKGPLYRFETKRLSQIYTIVFSIVFLHLGAIVASLLCSNHVNSTFGKGLTPRAYRLDVGHVRRNAINIIRILTANKSQNVHVHHLLHVDQSTTHCLTSNQKREFQEQ